MPERGAGSESRDARPRGARARGVSMKAVARAIAALAAGGFGLLCISAVAGAQVSQTLQPVGQLASLAPGSIDGVVHGEKDAPIAGAVVSALGAKRVFAVTDRSGHFELRTLSPGPYLVRAHLSGFIAPPGRIVDVHPSSRVSSWIALHRAASSSLPVLAAGVATVARSSPAAAEQPA